MAKHLASDQIYICHIFFLLGIYLHFYNRKVVKHILIGILLILQSFLPLWEHFLYVDSRLIISNYRVQRLHDAIRKKMQWLHVIMHGALHQRSLVHRRFLLISKT